MKRIAFLPASLAATSLRLAAAFAALLVAGSVSSAESWKPTETVNIIVPYGPGGANDRAARLVQKIISDNKLVDQNVVVVNKPGGSTAIATHFVSEQQGNPHYLLFSAPATLTANILGRTDVSFTAFTPIAALMNEYDGIIVRPDLDVKNARDLKEKLQADPGSVRFGVAAVGGPAHMGIGMVLHGLGVDVQKTRIAQFDSGGELMTALLGGHVDAIVAPSTELPQRLENGSVRVLGILAANRIPVVPDQPTWKEQGIDVAVPNWRGILAPGGLTEEQRAYWEDVFKKVEESPEFIQTLSDWGAVPELLVGDEFEAFLKVTYDQYSQVLLTDLGLKKSQ